MATPTTNAVPSSAAADLLFNSEKIDAAVNTSAATYTDRFGVSRLTLAGAVARISAVNMRGAWATATAYAARDVVSDSGTWYIALDAHTSGASFAGDASAHWRVYQGVLEADMDAAIAAALAERAENAGHVQQVMQKLRQGLDCHIVVCGDSTGDSTTEWVYRLATLLGLDYLTHTVRYRLWDTGTSNYGAITTIQTGTGGTPPTLNFWNASIAGSVANRFAGADLDAAVRPASIGADPDLVMLSYGHNGGNDIERQIGMTAVMAGEVARLMPFCPIVLIGQNPVTTDETMAAKVRVFRSLASAQGLGWIDVHAYFKDNADPIGDYYQDTVHPNDAGSTLWAAAAHAVFRYSINAVAGPALSPLSRGVIYAADSYAALSGWTLANCTAARDAAVFETNGESIQLTGATGAGQCSASKVVIDSSDITAYRGRYVTVTARVRVPDGANADAGRLALYDGTTTITTANGGPQGTDWVTQSITLQVDLAAVSLTAIAYLTTNAAGTSDVIHIDRVTVVDGPLPADSALPSVVDDLDYLGLLGSRSAGVLVVRNAANAGRAIQVLDTSAGTNFDDPNTQYVVSVSAGGVAVKQRGDAFDRLQINSSTGAILLGDGTATPAIQVRSGGAELLRVIAAHLYNDADNTYDLGLSNKRWRRVYGGEFRPTATVIWKSGAGTPEGAVTAPVGSLYTRTDGGASTTLYVKESGTAATGWVAK